jgi:hypothetical protein
MRDFYMISPTHRSNRIVYENLTRIEVTHTHAHFLCLNKILCNSEICKILNSVFDWLGIIDSGINICYLSPC